MPDQSTTLSIPIACCETDIRDYILVELNGELIAPVEFPSEQESVTVLGVKDQVELGKLSLDHNNKNPLLILGSHQLKGKIEQLKEPYALMEKQYDERKQLLESYRTIGFVKKKFIFNQYPKVIMR